LLQMQRPQPVVRGVAAFFGRHPMQSDHGDAGVRHPSRNVGKSFVGPSA
jgi:hypothetical protein